MQFGKAKLLVKEPELARNTDRQLLRFRAAGRVGGQRLQHPLDEAGDLVAVPALVGLTKLGVQRGQLPDAPGSSLLAAVGDRRRLDLGPQSHKLGLKCSLHFLVPKG